MIIEKSLQELNPVKDSLTFKLLNSLPQYNSLSDTIDLYDYMKNVDNFKKYLSEDTFSYSTNFNYDSHLGTISIGNVGIDVITKFISFSNSLIKIYRGNSIADKDKYNKDYEHFVSLLKNEITTFNINHELEYFFIDSNQLQKINTFVSDPTDDNLKKFRKVLEDCNSTFKYHRYPIFSLLSPLTNKDCIEVLNLWLDKSIISRNDFNKDLLSLDFENSIFPHIIFQRINSHNFKEALEILNFMDVPLSENRYLISKIDDCELVEEIINTNDINPYEIFEYKFFGQTKKTTTLHQLISSGHLVDKQKILHMFSLSKFSSINDLEKLKNQEFLNLVESGHNLKDLKNFITTRNIDFKTLIYEKLDNKSALTIISKHHNWWLIPFFVKAENELLQEGKETPAFFAEIIHTDHDVKYLNKLISHLDKIVNAKTLNLHIDNLREVFTNSFHNHKFNINKLLFKKPGMHHDLDNIHNKVVSGYYPKENNIELFNYDSMFIPIDNKIEATYSLYGDNKHNYSSYFYSMYLVKQHTNKKNDFLTDIDKVKSNSFYGPDNLFLINNFHILLTDYFMGSKIFPVPVEKGQDMENKIIDILSDFMYNIYKESFDNRKVTIKNSVAAINYSLSILEQNSQDKDLLKNLLLNNDKFIDSFFAFTEVLKDYDLSEPSINASYLNNTQKYLIDKARDLYSKNLEKTLPQNNIPNIIKKF